MAAESTRGVKLMMSLFGDHHSILIDPRTLRGSMQQILYKFLDINELRGALVMDEVRRDEIRCEWQQLAMLIDRFSFFFFLLATLIMWIAFYSEIPSYEETPLA